MPHQLTESLQTSATSAADIALLSGAVATFVVSVPQRKEESGFNSKAKSHQAQLGEKR